MKRILVVEDDPAIRDGLHLLLSDKYTILQAKDGREALQVLSQETVDLVLLDMLMPILDGEGVLRCLAARDLSVPVVVMSAHRNLKNRGGLLGVAGVLAKPFNLAQLEECIGGILGPDDDQDIPGGSGPGSGSGLQGPLLCRSYRRRRLPTAGQMWLLQAGRGGQPLRTRAFRS